MTKLKQMAPKASKESPLLEKLKVVLVRQAIFQLKFQFGEMGAGAAELIRGADKTSAAVDLDSWDYEDEDAAPPPSEVRAQQKASRLARPGAVRPVRTSIHVRLFETARTFISRPEGKRLCAGLERFSEALLDFQGVTAVGQGFCDEVFRVWARAHPGTRLLLVNACEDVEWFIRKAYADAKTLPSGHRRVPGAVARSVALLEAEHG